MYTGTRGGFRGGFLPGPDDDANRVAGQKARGRCRDEPDGDELVPHEQGEERQASVIRCVRVVEKPVADHDEGGSHPTKRTLAALRTGFAYRYGCDDRISGQHERSNQCRRDQNGYDEPSGDERRPELRGEHFASV